MSDIKQTASTEISNAWDKIIGHLPVDNPIVIKDLLADLNKTRDNIKVLMGQKEPVYADITKEAAKEAAQRAIATSLVHKQYELSRTEKIKAGVNTAKALVNQDGILDVILQDSK